MSRLTYINKENDYELEVCSEREYSQGQIGEMIYDIAQKLGKLEDLEEELGCPFEVVIHLNWRRPFYYETKDKKLILILYYEFLQDHITFLITSNNPNKECTTIELKDYKKSFWLKKDKSE